MKIVVLGGDGIGPEVTASAETVLRSVSSSADLKLEFEHHLVGGACYDETGKFSTDEMMNAARNADAILFGSEGGPKWDVLEIDCTPEERAGLTRLRRELQLFANLRPIKALSVMKDRSTVRPEVTQGVDFIILRELCGGIYFGTPRGIAKQSDGSYKATDTLSYEESEVERLAHVAFTLARSRRGRVTSVDKANVMETSVLWRKVFTRIHAEQYSDIELSHMYIDNASMQVIRDPRQFDVLATENLFGDILSDGSAMLTGSLGMLPSAAIGKPNASGQRPGLYEPVHGSANDLAGQDVANPIGAILSAALLLRHSLERDDLAKKIESAVEQALESGDLTRDLGGTTGTKAFTEAVVRNLEAA